MLLVVLIDSVDQPNGPGMVIARTRSIEAWEVQLIGDVDKRDPRARFWVGNFSIGTRVYRRGGSVVRIPPMRIV